MNIYNLLKYSLSIPIILCCLILSNNSDSLFAASQQNEALFKSIQSYADRLSMPDEIKILIDEDPTNDEIQKVLSWVKAQ